MKNILVIGGSGFIGTHLVKKLQELKYNVTVFDRYISDKSIPHIEKDLKDIGVDVQGFDTIFDLAGSTDNYAINDGEPFRDIESNCTATVAWLEALRKYNPKAKLIFASTFFVNGHAKKIPVDEEQQPDPLGLYGATKLCAEHFCKIYANLFDMDISIARFCNVYGPGEPGLNKKKAAFNYLIRQAVLGNEIQMYAQGDFYRDYIYVEDIVDACIIMGDKSKTGEIYYVGNGKYVKFYELINIISKHTSAPVVSINPPEFHNRVGIKDFVCDNTKIKALGWQPKISPEEGIKKVIEYYKIKEGSDGVHFDREGSL